VIFLLFYAATHTYSEFSLKCTGDRPRQSAYKIKLMLWRVSWALAQISCYQILTTNVLSALEIFWSMRYMNLHFIQGGPKKVSCKLLSISLPNVNRFSNFFSPAHSVENLW